MKSGDHYHRSVSLVAAPALSLLRPAGRDLLKRSSHQRHVQQLGFHYPKEFLPDSSSAISAQIFFDDLVRTTTRGIPYGRCINQLYGMDITREVVQIFSNAASTTYHTFHICMLL
jgi:hypothetical protein